MRVIDFIPDVLEILKVAGKPLNQSDLTERLWGSSGKNSPHLVNLFNHMVGSGSLIRCTKGRTKWYSLPQV